MHMVLLSEGAADLAACRARQLGADRYCAGMTSDDKIRLLRELRQQRIAVAYVGDCSANAPVAREAHLSIDLSGADSPAEMGSDIALTALSISPLPALCALARDSAGRKKRVGYKVMVPNLLCVGGAFALEFTAMPVVLISNFGTSLAYAGAKRALRRSTVVPHADRAEIRTGI